MMDMKLAIEWIASDWRLHGEIPSDEMSIYSDAISANVRAVGRLIGFLFRADGSSRSLEVEFAPFVGPAPGSMRLMRLRMISLRNSRTITPRVKFGDGPATLSDWGLRTGRGMREDRADRERAEDLGIHNQGRLGQ